MIRTDAAMKPLTTVLLTVATAFAQSSDRLPVTDAEKIAERIASRSRFHYQGRDSARLAIGAWRRIPAPS